MWWDPTIREDEHFLQLMATVNSMLLYEYPIEAKRLRGLIAQSIDKGSILASIGGFQMLKAKNSQEHLKKQFDIHYLDLLDTLFFILSDNRTTLAKQDIFHWYAGKIFQRWFQDCGSQKLEHLLTSLTNQIDILQKCFKDTQSLNERKIFCLKTLNFFHKQFQDKITEKDHQYYQQKFKQHAEFIFRNKKQISFVNFLHQIKYLLTNHIYSHQYYIEPEQLIKILHNQLFYVQLTGLSITIQNMAFVLKKMLEIKTQIPQQQYQLLKNQITLNVQKYQIIPPHLQQKSEYFAFHMKPHNYFDFLQQIFVKRNEQSQMINGWKHSIRKAIEGSVSMGKKPDINQAIFYLQLRTREAYLWGDNANKVNQFPDINSLVIRRSFQHYFMTMLEDSEDFCPDLINLILMAGEIQIQQIYKNMNLIERGVFVYYLIYYKSIKSVLGHKKLKQITQIQANSGITAFFNNLSNEHLIQLFNFYLLQIRLGNHYRTQFPSHQIIENSVNCQVYSQIITTLFQRVKNSLNLYKELKTTSDLKTLNHFIRYLNVLIKGIISDGQMYFLCSICKRTFNLWTCPYCNNILIGYKIHPRNNRQYPQKHRLFYTQMVNQLTKKVKKIHKQLYLQVQENPAEWLKMFTIALQDSILTLAIML